MADVEKAVSSTVSNVDSGVDLLHEAQQSFGKIVTAVEKMAENIIEVSASAEQISASTQEVAASVNEMSQAAQFAAQHAQTMATTTLEQAASVDEVNNVAKTLSEDVMKLQDELNQFKY